MMMGMLFLCLVAGIEGYEYTKPLPELHEAAKEVRTTSDQIDERIRESRDNMQKLSAEYRLTTDKLRKTTSPDTQRLLRAERIGISAQMASEGWTVIQDLKDYTKQLKTNVVSFRQAIEQRIPEIDSAREELVGVSEEIKGSLEAVRVNIDWAMRLWSGLRSDPDIALQLQRIVAIHEQEEQSYQRQHEHVEGVIAQSKLSLKNFSEIVHNVLEYEEKVDEWPKKLEWEEKITRSKIVVEKNRGRIDLIIIDVIDSWEDMRAPDLLGLRSVTRQYHELEIEPLKMEMEKISFKEHDSVEPLSEEEMEQRLSIRPKRRTKHE